MPAQPACLPGVVAAFLNLYVYFDLKNVNSEPPVPIHCNMRSRLGRQYGNNQLMLPISSLHTTQTGINTPCCRSPSSKLPKEPLVLGRVESCAHHVSIMVSAPQNVSSTLCSGALRSMSEQAHAGSTHQCSCCPAQLAAGLKHPAQHLAANILLQYVHSPLLLKHIMGVMLTCGLLIHMQALSFFKSNA